MITTTLHDNDAGCSTSNVYLHPVVNGIEVSPSGYASFKTNSSTICFDNRTAQWWLDIDAHGLVGVPLTICLEGSAFPSQAFQVITSAIQEAK